MEYVSCVLCGGSETGIKIVQRDVNLHHSEQEFTLVRCKRCGLIFLNPRPTPEEIHAFYPKEYYPLEDNRERRSIDRFFQRLSNGLKRGIREEFCGYPQRSGNDRSALGHFLRRLMLYPEYWHLKLVGRDILPYRGCGRVLDVGCGPGKMLRVLRDWGWDTYGVDFSAVAVECAQGKHGLNVKLGDLKSAAYADDFFDVVMFNHCLEHVFDPMETLREAWRILKPGGLLTIMIPNAGGFEARIFGKWWVQWDVPRHLFHFTKATMSQLLTKTNFGHIRIDDGMGATFFLGSLDYFYKHVLHFQNGTGRLGKYLLARPISFLAGHLGYGSEMKVFAEKPMVAK